MNLPIFLSILHLYTCNFSYCRNLTEIYLIETNSITNSILILQGDLFPHLNFKSNFPLYLIPLPDILVSSTTGSTCYSNLPVYYILLTLVPANLHPAPYLFQPPGILYPFNSSTCKPSPCILFIPASRISIPNSSLRRASTTRTTRRW